MNLEQFKPDDNKLTKYQMWFLKNLIFFYPLLLQTNFNRQV